MTKLANEYRETMDKDVLHSWARDAVEEIRRLEATIDRLETKIDDLYLEIEDIRSEEHYER